MPGIDPVRDFLERHAARRMALQRTSLSDCCGAPGSGEYLEAGICPECREHCEFVYDEGDPANAGGEGRKPAAEKEA